MANEYSPMVLCAEEANTAREDYDEERGLMNASVTLRCAYGDRHLLVGDVCGNARPWPKGASGIVPRAHSAGITADMSVGSFTLGSQLWMPYWALVTLKYSTRVTDIITEEIEAASQFNKLDFKMFGWSGPTGDTLMEEEAPAMQFRSLNLVRTEQNQNSVPGVLYDLVGCCNNAPYTSPILGRTFGVETLLLTSPVVHYKKNSIGDVKFDVTKKFTIQAQGWNRYFRTKTNSFEEIFSKETCLPYKCYPPTDLSGILYAP